MDKRFNELKSKVDVLWQRFCKRELTLDQLIEEVNRLERMD